MRKNMKVVKYCDLQIECMPQMQLNIWLSPFEKQHRNPCYVHTSVYQDLPTYHHWLIKKAIIYLHIKLMGKSKCNHHFHIDCNAPCLPPPQKKKKILHNHCLQFLLGITVVPREIKDSGYAKCLGVNKVHYHSKEICISFHWPRAHHVTCK